MSDHLAEFGDLRLIESPAKPGSGGRFSVHHYASPYPIPQAVHMSLQAFCAVGVDINSVAIPS
jgi:hypothetical protein